MLQPIALYARCSTTDQHPEAQLAELRAYAERRGLKAVEYVDSGVSGRKDRRPALDRMMQAARRRVVSGVVVVRLDRLARSLAHMARLGEELEAVVCQNSAGRLSGPPVVIVEDPSQPFMALNSGILVDHAATIFDQPIIESLMVSLDVVMLRVSLHSVA